MPAGSALLAPLRQLANYAPIVAALLAPASTMYDIPALSQKWYSLDGQELPDPLPSLVLSGFSLAASVIANSLLVLRFSVRVSKSWRLATRLSTLCWLVKTIIGMANLITFGALRRNGPGYAYLEGFWCAILSVVLGGLITTLLISHYLLHFSNAPDEKVRFEGRTLILSELILFGLISLNALVFSQIEGWTYLDGLYFSVVALLSIGFGDFKPTYVATKILLFPYVVVGIALLANQISIIVEASSHRAHIRKRRMREHYASKFSAFEQRHSRFSNDHDQQTDSEALHTEVERVRKEAQREADANQLAELVYSACALVLFWLFGALIYHYMEGWTYGDSLYFNYVFFLTIGFGDLSPATQVGKVVFIIWSMLAVPIMTNFVVSTIQSLVTHGSRILALATTQKKMEKKEIEKEYFQPHSSYLEEAIRRLQGDSDKDDSSPRESDVEAQVDAESRDSPMLSVEKELLFDLLSTSCLLEAQARTIMLEKMDTLSHARVLLEADSNLQLYTLDRLGKTNAIDWLEDHEKSMRDGDTLQRVREYRKTFAKMLVMGSRLMSLEGDDLLAFQRKRTRDR